MKKLLLFFALAAISLTNVWAYDFSAIAPSGQTLYYNITSSSDKTVSVTFPGSGSGYYWTNYNKLTGDLTIPKNITYEGLTYSVTSIGDYAFFECEFLTSVTIPNSVTRIGHYAFSTCRGLTSVTIPNSVTSVGSYAFNLVNNIVYNGSATGTWGELTLNGFVDGDLVYKNTTKTELTGCSASATSVNIPNSVTSIGHCAFYGCSGLTSVTIPNSVTSIGDDAFENCSGLTSVIIGNSVTSIGNFAFRDCSGLTSVNIPNAVTSIGYYAFYGCSGFMSVTIGNSVTSIGNFAFRDCSGLTSVTIPNSVTSIGNDAFENCSGLTSVTIPNSVTSIGQRAFSACRGLTSVTIPNSVTSIGRYAFRWVNNIVYNGSATGTWGELTLNGFVDGDLVYKDTTKTELTGCSASATSVNIPNSVTSIGHHVFYGCSGLTSVTIPNSVTSIGDSAFFGCNNLTETTSEAVIAPILGTSVFSGVNSQISINIPCGSSMSYYSRWPYFSNFVETGFSFSASSNDNSMGTVSILIQPACPAWQAVINADPATGYRFDHWSNGETENPYILSISSDTSLTASFVLLEKDTVIVNDTAYIYEAVHDTTITYVPIHDTSYVDVIVHDTVLAYIMVHDTTTIYVPVHDTSYVEVYVPVHDTTIAYIPVHDTTIVDNFIYDTTYLWQYDTTYIDNFIHDTTYIDVFVPVHDTTIVDNFIYDTTYLWQYDTTYIDRYIHDTSYVDVYLYDTTIVHDTVIEQLTYYTLSVVSGNSNRGLVSGNGTFPDGTEVEIAAIPIQGNMFVQWADGNTENPRRVTVNGNMNYVATFETSPVGVTEVEGVNFTIDTENGAIVVKDAPEMQIRIFDNLGRCLITNKGSELVRMFNMPATGAYMVQVGNYPAQKVVVVK